MEDIYTRSGLPAEGGRGGGGPGGGGGGGGGPGENRVHLMDLLCTVCYSRTRTKKKLHNVRTLESLRILT